jgi:alkanesulfonate monooxygenase SsuD/methylene tetrahydromethanopterin reductase-like flavin-dependent oxidoreductase (luciferase family)
MQAGQSGRGRRFATRWGELLFVVFPTLELARTGYREIKEEAARAGRDPDRIKICPAAYCIVGESKAVAEEQLAYIEELIDPADALVLLSEVLNFDFARKGLDDTFSDEELASISGLQAIRDRVVRQSGKTNPTTRDFVEFSGRGTLREHPRFVGSPKEVADGLEEWFVTEGCDGFVLAATHVPGAYEDFVRFVVPELQRRGIHQREYAGTTLRENLGLPRAERGDWMPR